METVHCLLFVYSLAVYSLVSFVSLVIGSLASEIEKLKVAAAAADMRREDDHMHHMMIVVGKVYPVSVKN